MLSCKALPGLGRLAVCVLLTLGLVTGLVGFPPGRSGPAHAQESGTGFNLENIKRMMEDIKRKADEARLNGTEREQAGQTPEAAQPVTSSQDGSDPVLNEQATQPTTAARPSETSPSSVAAPLPLPPQPPPTSDTAVASPEPLQEPGPPTATEPMLRNKADGRAVDPTLAAAREEEADAVLDAIRRARNARDAWLDDNPDPVLDTLPSQPPPRRFANPPSREDPRIAPAVPVSEPKQAAARRDEFDLDNKQGLGGPGARELLPFEDDGRDVRSENQQSLAQKPTRRATVLLVMDVGKTGIRRWSKTADPMLCVQEFCFLSRGPNKAAVRHRRQVAFGPGVALGKRGLACRSSPACIFRNIDLGAFEARLQPVDLRYLRHDRREAELVKADVTCGMKAGRLTCGKPVKGKSWRAWVVPELVAELAGEDALKRALADGLGGTSLPLTASQEKKRYRNR
ncbi:MAG: hypothetical protein AAFV45_03000 [Pseudomonadota bacterium]